MALLLFLFRVVLFQPPPLFFFRSWVLLSHITPLRRMAVVSMYAIIVGAVHDGLDFLLHYRKAYLVACITRNEGLETF
ncbi:hypothetical protein QBC35DRAFT_497567 [Podospora australis]|uniref:Uncharacterized protein n=1 Tax=Podospora australis TaxID=1536484 RepID=A0AAN6WTD7_9PEZI|nr:hypothetical protein QBC35DRAFT_497567 [Podospora australis]